MPHILAESVPQLMDQVVAMQDEWNKVGKAEELEADLANLIFTAMSTALPLQKEAAERSPRQFIDYCYEKAGFKPEEIPDHEDINKSTVLARCFLQKIAQFFMTVHQRAATSAQHAFMLPADVKEKMKEQQKALEEMRIEAKEEYDKRSEAGEAKTIKFPGAKETDPQEAPTEAEKKEKDE